MKLKIPAKALSAALPSSTTDVYRVRLVLAMNADITLKQVTVEGQVVPKWKPVGSYWYWENPTQVITDTLDVKLEAWGGPNGAIALVTICGNQKCGTINLDTTTGHAAKEESYVI